MSTALRALLRLTLVVCAAFSLAATAAESLLEEARSLIEQGRHDAALSRVERFLSESPGDERARFLKGVLLVETGRSDEAVAEFQALVRDHPELPEPYNNLAVLYAARGQYTEARDALLGAINTHPSYAIAHENLGDIYAKLAGIAYDKALSLDSSNLAARGKLALVHELFSSEAGRAASGAIQPVAAPAAASVTALPEPPAADARQAVRDAVVGWATAWAAQDVPSYLRHYGREFQPPGGVARATWEAERERRLRAPASIEVNIDDLQVELLGVDRARAVFSQRYRSDSYADRVRKVLGLAREREGWRIVSEVSD